MKYAVEMDSGDMIYTYFIKTGTNGSVVGSSTMLQAGSSRVRLPMRSLDFSIDLIFPAVVRPSDRLSL
jgi:hypothetical protein